MQIPILILGISFSVPSLSFILPLLYIHSLSGWYHSLPWLQSCWTHLFQLLTLSLLDIFLASFKSLIPFYLLQIPLRYKPEPAIFTSPPILAMAFLSLGNSITVENSKSCYTFVLLFILIFNGLIILKLQISLNLMAFIGRTWEWILRVLAEVMDNMKLEKGRVCWYDVTLYISSQGWSSFFFFFFGWSSF